MIPKIMGLRLSPTTERDIYTFMLPFLSFVVCIGAEEWLAEFARDSTLLWRIPARYTLPLRGQQMAHLGILGLPLRKDRGNWSFQYAFIPAEASDPFTTVPDPLIRLQFSCWNRISAHTLRVAVEV